LVVWRFFLPQLELTFNPHFKEIVKLSQTLLVIFAPKKESLTHQALSSTHTESIGIGWLACEHNQN
jgi:hypothetical protein